jgi:hypothetical protein
MKPHWIILIFILGFGVGFFYFNGDKGISGNVVLESGHSFDEILALPVRAHIVSDDSGYYTTSRSVEEVAGLFVEVNRIWAPAKIKFEDEVVESRLSFGAIPKALNKNLDELRAHKNIDPEKINVFFVQSLNSAINGFTVVGENIILISDYNRVNDFRTLAHELGHAVGLKHVEDSGSLMHRRTNGEDLSGLEINLAREGALKIHNN